MRGLLDENTGDVAGPTGREAPPRSLFDGPAGSTGVTGTGAPAAAPPHNLYALPDPSLDVLQKLLSLWHPTPASSGAAIQPPNTAPTRPTALQSSRSGNEARMPLSSAVDWNFIHGREGDGLTGYVPRDSTGQRDQNSGVTVAHGLDLGHHDAAELRAMGIDENMIGPMSRYYGRFGQAAEDFRVRNPIQFTPEQQAEIDRHVDRFYQERLARRYDRDALTGLRFENLPTEAQTAIADADFQYGGRLPERTPVFWNQITHAHWRDALRNLRDFRDTDPHRRNREADLLEPAINSGRLRDATPPPRQR